MQLLNVSIFFDTHTPWHIFIHIQVLNTGNALKTSSIELDKSGYSLRIRCEKGLRMGYRLAKQRQYFLSQQYRTIFRWHSSSVGLCRLCGCAKLMWGPTKWQHIFSFTIIIFWMSRARAPPAKLMIRGHVSRYTQIRHFRAPIICVGPPQALYPALYSFSAWRPLNFSRFDCYSYACMLIRLIRLILFII